MNNTTLANLGTVAVLDATNLNKGSIVEIDGQALQVKQIIDENVYLEPLTGWKLCQYRWTTLNWFGKALCIGVGSIIPAAIIKLIL